MDKCGHVRFEYLGINFADHEIQCDYETGSTKSVVLFPCIVLVVNDRHGRSF